MIFSCIRHGRTEMNALDLVCGVTDIPLIDVGIEQAKKASDDIYQKIQKSEIPPIDLIISSPLLRAQQTAQIIASKLNISYQIDKRITEQNYGEMEGCNRFDKKYLAIRSQFAVKYPKGESMLHVAQRVYNFLDEVKQNYKNHNHILLVCHGGTIRLINTYFCDYSNVDFADFRAENCQIQTFFNKQN